MNNPEYHDQIRNLGVDLIISINDRTIADVAAFEQGLAAIKDERPKVLKVFVLRDHRTNFVFIEPDWPEPEETT